MDKHQAIIERILEARFTKAEAQALRFGRARLARKDIQYMDVKLMSELMERYRGLVREGVRACRAARARRDVETDHLARLYLGLEAEAAAHKVDGLFSLYRIANLDYHALRRAYLYKCLGPRMTLLWEKVA